MVKSLQVIADAIVCKDGTGAFATPSVGPAGALYKNGVVTADVVTITGATHLWKWALTFPVLAPGDRVAVYITATIDGVATGKFVFRDMADTAYVSDVNTELAKVPKSDGAATWNNTALASINTEVDTALNTAIPGSPTANSINERIKAIDVLTESGGAGDLAAILTDTAAIVPPPIVI